MLRNILVRLNFPGEHSVCHEQAVRFAAQYESTLTGLYVRDRFRAYPIVPSYSWGAVIPAPLVLNPVGSASLTNRVRFDEQQSVQEAEITSAFLYRAKASHVPARLDIRQGDFRDEFLKAAHFADLIVVAHPDDDRSILASESGDLIRAARRPFLLARNSARAIAKIVIAYDGTEGSIRALMAAADIAVNGRPRVDKLTVVNVSPVGHAPSADLRGAGQYLDSYGLLYETVLAQGTVSEQILACADRTSADLLCLGAYGHSFIRELALGSVTQSIIARHEMPLLVCS